MLNIPANASLKEKVLAIYTIEKMEDLEKKQHEYIQQNLFKEAMTELSCIEFEYTQSKSSSKVNEYNSLKLLLDNFNLIRLQRKQEALERKKAPTLSEYS